LDRQETLIVHSDPKAPVSEAFRTLRTNIQFSSFDGEVKKIMLTSAIPGDGKSTVTANLAVAVAQTGKSCILVDCDLRRPVLHKFFGISNRRGLVNLLLGDLTLEEAIVPTHVENLSVINSGPIPPNPAELVGSVKMDKVYQDLSDRYDYVIIDCPPVMAVTDAVMISKKVDGVLLVVGAGTTPRQAVIGAKNSLDGVGARILGVVLNQVDIKGAYGSYYYYYYQPYYGSKE
jgi:capsular exopolysaccharide synthesis family protein